MLPLNENLLCSIDVETTGNDPELNEIVQIAIQPAADDLTVPESPRPFYYNIRPENIATIQKRAMAAHGINLDDLLTKAPRSYTVARLFEEWFEHLDIREGRRIMPLAQNWPYEACFLKHWLGESSFNFYFDSRYRDTMGLARDINDLLSVQGFEPLFKRTNLATLCRKLHVENVHAHNALADARATLEVYRKMLHCVTIIGGR